jgi:hypothetical protein
MSRVIVIELELAPVSAQTAGPAVRLIYARSAEGRR